MSEKTVGQELVDEINAKKLERQRKKMKDVIEARMHNVDALKKRLDEVAKMYITAQDKLKEVLNMDVETFVANQKKEEDALYPLTNSIKRVVSTSTTNATSTGKW